MPSVYCAGIDKPISLRRQVDAAQTVTDVETREQGPTLEVLAEPEAADDSI